MRGTKEADVIAADSAEKRPLCARACSTKVLMKNALAAIRKKRSMARRAFPGDRKVHM